jgi:hypothetical protein
VRWIINRAEDVSELVQLRLKHRAQEPSQTGVGTIKPLQ